jgi:hypothetical protein
MHTSKTAKENQIGAADLDPALTIPISVRVPARVGFLLYLYAERMNTSSGKLLTSLLEDTLPAFKESKNFQVTLRVPQVYKAMENANLLQSVNVEDLKERVAKRAEAGGPMGRPRKVGRHGGQEEA